MISNFILHDETDENALERELLENLQRRRLSHQFLFWGRKEAERWHSLCQDKSYLYFAKELFLLSKSLPTILGQLHAKPETHYNILSLGISNGQKDMLLWDAFQTYKKFSYFPFDISEAILRMGMEKMTQLKEVEAYITDVNKIFPLSGAIRKNNFPHHLICLLGNTLGNVRHLELLTRIRESMEPGDYLLLGVMLQKKGDLKSNLLATERILDMYSSHSFQTFAFTPLERFGFTQEHGTIEVEYAPSKFFPALHAVDIMFALSTNRSVTYLNQELHFQKGERISLFRSYVYPEEILRNLLEMHHFQIAERYLSSDKMVGLYLCTV